jgi:hypothetical protein
MAALAYVEKHKIAATIEAALAEALATQPENPYEALGAWFANGGAATVKAAASKKEKNKASGGAAAAAAAPATGYKVLAVNDDLPIRTDQPIHSGKVRAVYWLTKKDSARLIAEKKYDVAAGSELAVMVISDRISAYEIIWKGEGGMTGPSFCAVFVCFSWVLFFSFFARLFGQAARAKALL